MKKTIELHLKNREVYQLFERKIKGNRLFIDAVLHKLNQITGQFHRQESKGIVSHQQIEKVLLGIVQQFEDEITLLDSIIIKKQGERAQTKHFSSKFRPKVTIDNPLKNYFVDLIETYDQLITTFKTLHRMGCFASYDVFFINIKRVQKNVNRVFSCIVLSK